MKEKIFIIFISIFCIISVSTNIYNTIQINNIKESIDGIYSYNSEINSNVTELDDRLSDIYYKISDLTDRF